MKRKKSAAVIFFWVIEGLCLAAALLFAVCGGVIAGDWGSVLYAVQIPLHFAVLAGAVRLVVMGLKRKTKYKKTVRAAMAAGGFAAIFLLTVYGGILPFQTDAETPALLEQTQETCSEFCASKGFTGTGMIYNDQIAEFRTAGIYRLPQEEAAAKRAYRRLAGDIRNGSASPVNLLPFVHRRLPLGNGYALISPVIATRLGTLPFGGEYLGFVLIHAGEENYCVEYVMNSDFILGNLFCSGPENRSLSALTQKILDDPGGFLLSPQPDPALS